MKKLIAILVVFALAMGAAFAEASVSGAVFGTVTLMGSDTSKATDGVIYGGLAMDRVRIEAAGGDDDGTFGAWIRLDKGSYGPGQANVWWKPIDQFRLLIGGNADGMYGKEGVTGWGFHQTPTDTGVAINGDNVWGSSHYLSWQEEGSAGDLVNKLAGYNFRNIFYGGYGGDALMLEIKPMDMLSFNIVLPYKYRDYDDTDRMERALGALTFQADLNLDFGNFAITYVGYADSWTAGEKDDRANNGTIYIYAGIPIGDSVALDVGLSTMFAGKTDKDCPINIGAGVKIGINEQFGIKARLGASVPMDDAKITKVLFDVLPYYAINDTMTVFIGIGLGLIDVDGETQYTGFHFNPYLQVGSEWGPKFLAGLKVVQGYADGGDSIYGGDSVVNWSVPIALQVSF